MKILLILLFCVSVYGQYSDKISVYNIYWNKLDSEAKPTIDYTFKSDTTITLSWEVSHKYAPAYISPYTAVTTIAMVVVNAPFLWEDSIATVRREIKLNNGLYQVIVTESDQYKNEGYYSGKPLFISIEKSDIRIQINLRTR
jgi:hypothetical protein